MDATRRERAVINCLAHGAQERDAVWKMSGVGRGEVDRILAATEGVERNEHGLWRITDPLRLRRVKKRVARGLAWGIKEPKPEPEPVDPDEFVRVNVRRFLGNRIVSVGMIADRFGVSHEEVSEAMHGWKPLFVEDYMRRWRHFLAPPRKPPKSTRGIREAAYSWFYFHFATSELARKIALPPSEVANGIQVTIEALMKACRPRGATHEWFRWDGQYLGIR